MRLHIYTIPVTNVSIGVCLYIGETNFPFSKCCKSQIATSTKFLEVQSFPWECVWNIWTSMNSRPCVWLRSVGVLWQAGSVQNLVGIIMISIWKDGVIATTTLFPHLNSRLHLGTLSHLAPEISLLFMDLVVPVRKRCASFTNRAITWDRRCDFESVVFQVDVTTVASDISSYNNLYCWRAVYDREDISSRISLLSSH